MLNLRRCLSDPILAVLVQLQLVTDRRQHCMYRASAASRGKT